MIITTPHPQPHQNASFLPQAPIPTTHTQPPEILDESNRLAVKDFYKAKQSQLLAMVASLPLLAGLLASVVLTLQSQELRRSALSPIETLAESMCINGQAVVQVGIRSRDTLSSIVVKDAQTEVSSSITQSDTGDFSLVSLQTKKTKLPSGFVVFSIIDGKGNTIKNTANYQGITCNDSLE